MTPAVISEEQDFLIVDKPAGWLVHPTRPDGTFTLIDWLRDQYPDEFLSLISRLDRETSGLLLVGRGKENASIFGKMQQRREIQKSYLALVHGCPPSSGLIDQPLDRLGKHQPSRIYMRQAVVPGTYPAQTEYKTVGTRNHPTMGEISMVEATPKTGRLHQIRAHFEHIGYPVVNDKIYGKPDNVFLNYIDKEAKIVTEMARHSLHSSKISFFWVNSSISCEIPIASDLLAIWEGSDPTSVAMSDPTEIAI
jgi:23S rRNA pseudouridine1911/1915/1917 synthase